jgi:hypothetical protein
VSTLVVVAPLKDGALERARELLAEGPPFDLEASRFEKHEVFLTSREVVFVFKGGPGPGGTLALAAEDPQVWRAAKDWGECLDGRPRIARSVFAWKRESSSG